MAVCNLNGLAYRLNTTFEILFSRGALTRCQIMSFLYVVLRSHWTHHSRYDSSGRVIGLVAETSAWQHTTLTRDKLPFPGRIRTRNPSKRGQQTHAVDRAATGIGPLRYTEM
jgi:hypothetical protein